MKKTYSALFSLLAALAITPTPIFAKITAEASQKQTPVLIRKDVNEVLCIKISCDEKDAGTAVKRLVFKTSGTDEIQDIESVTVFFTGQDKKFSDKKSFSKPQPGADEIAFPGEAKLSAGDNYFWVSVKPNPAANLLNKIDLQCTRIELAGAAGNIVPADTTPKLAKRIGVSVRNAGDDGSKSYRIPGLVYTKKGTLVAVYDIRWKHSGDLQADIDVGVSRSKDGGQTWLPMQKAVDMGTFGGLPETQNGAGDPAILVDEKTGRLWIAAMWAHGRTGRTWDASGPGMTPAETSQFVLVYSDDDGATWSEPINITEQIKDPKWTLFFNGPGAGITMKDGTLVFPAQFRDEKKIPHSTIIYSKDRGKTWHVGTGAKPKTTEAQVVELENGNLMLNMRDDRGGARSVAVTSDFGKTWSEHPTSRKALPEPVCMASIIRMKLKDGREILAFCNPDTKRGRNNLTLKFSLDDGKTWPEKYNFLLYSEGCFGYSCLADMGNNTVGVFYEGANDMYFEKVSIEEILKR